MNTVTIQATVETPKLASSRKSQALPLSHKKKLVQFMQIGLIEVAETILEGGQLKKPQGMSNKVTIVYLAISMLACLPIVVSPLDATANPECPGLLSLDLKPKIEDQSIAVNPPVELSKATIEVSELAPVSERILNHQAALAFIEAKGLSSREELIAYIDKVENKILREELWKIERYITSFRNASKTYKLGDLQIEDMMLQEHLTRVFKAAEVGSQTPGRKKNNLSILESELKELSLWERMKACLSMQPHIESNKSFSKFRWNSLAASQINIGLSYGASTGIANFDVSEYAIRASMSAGSNLLGSYFAGKIRHETFGTRFVKTTAYNGVYNSIDVILFAFQPIQYVFTGGKPNLPEADQAIQRLLFNLGWQLHSVPRGILIQDLISGMQCLSKRNNSRISRVAPNIFQYTTSFAQTYMYFYAYNEVIGPTRPRTN